MKTKFLTAAAVTAAAVMAAAAPASASVFVQFVQGGNVTQLSGYTLLNAFETDTGIVGTGYLIASPPSDGNGAVIPTSNPINTNYLTVLGGGNATIALGANVHAFAFDWGSLDSYNKLVVSGVGGAFGGGADTADIIPGVVPANTPANGNQFLPGTNGLFIVTSDAGESFTSIHLSSTSNSFEIDNLVVSNGVPEPATWAMMITGFGLAGATMRRRRAVALTA